jgi:hypothetical protein
MSHEPDDTRWALQIIMEFDAALFRHVGVSKWNDFVGELRRLGLVPVAWAKEERPTPLGIMLSFEGLQARHCRLDRLDFTFCDLTGADLDGSSLKGAKICDCPGANLRATRLQGAEFRGDMSSCDLTGAAVEGADFRHAYHYEGKPPLGLPPEAMAAIKVVPKEERDGDADEPFMQPLRVKAVIHEVPW